ncbi:LysR family transcriptional regulator [Escherichia coli]
MDLRDLKTFLHLAESRRLAAARGRCTLARPRSHNEIQRLEEDLGQPLFVRAITAR